MPVGLGTSFGSPLTESRRGSKYGYRHRMGLVACAEFDVFHDDFHSFIIGTAITNGPVAQTPLNGWQGAIIDSGSTTTINTTATTGANGVLKLTDVNASEGVAIYSNKSFQLISGKRFFIEARVRTDDVTDNELQIGLDDQTATTNPEDLWTTTAANLVTFGLLDGSAYPQMLVDKSNGGTSVQTQTIKPMVADTWHILAIGYDGAAITGWIDGDLVMTWSGASSTIPTATALGIHFGARNGDGAGGNIELFDYIRVVSER